MISFRMTIATIAVALTLPLAAGGSCAIARKELKRVDLDGVPGMEVVSSITEYKPGDELSSHLHHGVEAGNVVQGAMIQMPGKEPSVLPAGAAVLTCAT